jgi:tellurium resistance protein TerZ
MVHTLTKQDGDNDLTGVTVIKLGLAWEKVAGANDKGWRGKAKDKLREAQGLTDEGDADAGAVLFVGPDPVDYIGFGNLDGLKDEDTPAEKMSVQHSGDNLTGDGDGDDETVTVNLLDLPQRYTRVMLLAGAYKKGSKIEKIRGIRGNVYDATGGTAQKVATIQPSLLRQYDMMALADIKRGPNGFVLAINDGGFNLGENGKGDIRVLLRGAMNVLGA